METFYPILMFIVASVLTVLVAMRLAHYGDAIADTTGLGHSLVGLILLSAATSLPELFSSSSAAYIGNVDLSFGNVFGSNMTNIFILVIMDFFVRKQPILLGASQKNVMTGGIVIFVSSIALLMLYLANVEQLKAHDFWYFSPILFLFYIGGMVIIYRHESSIKTVDEPDQGPKDPSMTKAKAITGFVVSSVFVFGAAILLSYSSDLISQMKVGG
ncbi:MAG: hypothetical protein OEZ36_11465, partial [Spirochaetota bacterium]|nr:hypothetical protein [Spirochaetota bacterium]